MEKGTEPTIKSGDKLKEIETNERVKSILIDFWRGYPIWRYWGIFEYYFGDKVGSEIIKELDNHNILDVTYPKKKGDKTYYSLAPKGVEIVISMINSDYSKETSEYSKKVLEYDQEVLRYTRETHQFNKKIIILTAGLFIIGGVALLIGLKQLILIYLQNPIF